MTYLVVQSMIISIFPTFAATGTKYHQLALSSTNWDISWAQVEISTFTDESKLILSSITTKCMYNTVTKNYDSTNP
jgi:hypothetical protein